MVARTHSRRGDSDRLQLQTIAASVGLRLLASPPGSCLGARACYVRVALMIRRRRENCSAPQKSVDAPGPRHALRGAKCMRTRHERREGRISRRGQMIARRRRGWGRARSGGELKRCPGEGGGVWAGLPRRRRGWLTREDKRPLGEGRIW